MCVILRWPSLPLPFIQIVLGSVPADPHDLAKEKAGVDDGWTKLGQ